MFDFLKLKDDVSTLRERHAALVQKANELTQETLSFSRGPAAKADIVRELDAWVDRRAAAGMPDLSDNLKSVFGYVQPSGGLSSKVDEGFGLTEDPRGDAPATASIDAFMCALFPQQVKAFLRHQVEVMPWPQERPTQDQWAKALEAKEAERQKLVDQINELEAQARDAGIRLSVSFVG